MQFQGFAGVNLRKYHAYLYPEILLAVVWLLR